MPKAKKNFSRGRAQPYPMRTQRVGRHLFGPNQFKSNLELSHQYRFLSSAATTTNITADIVVNSLGVVANTAGTTGYNIFKTFKVNKIEIWSPPAAQGSAVTCSVFFPSATNSPSREFSDTSISVAEPAHVVATPPPQSLCSFWQSGSAATVLWQMVAPPGSIIDVWFSLVLNDGTGTVATNATLVGGTVGVVYYCSLDSSTKAGSIYQPISLTCI